MNRKFNLIIVVLCVLIYGLVLYGCNGDTSLTSSPMPTSFPTRSPIVTSSPSPSATVAITVTPILSNSLVITPDDLFSFPELQVLSTPGSADFCENISPPQLINNGNELSTLAGRFLLCPSRSRPWVKMAMDLDTGALVHVDNEIADVVMEYAHVPLDGTISYELQGLNNAHVADLETNTLKYEYCEKVLLSMDENDPGIFDIYDGTIACTRTTEGHMAVIRVEKIYPLDTQSVEFSFALLRK